MRTTFPLSAIRAFYHAQSHIFSLLDKIIALCYHKDKEAGMPIVLSVVGGFIAGGLTVMLMLANNPNDRVMVHSAGIAWSRVLPIYAVAAGLIVAGAVMVG
jgi:hypothetical protein